MALLWTATIQIYTMFPHVIFATENILLHVYMLKTHEGLLLRSLTNKDGSHDGMISLKIAYFMVGTRDVV